MTTQDKVSGPASCFPPIGKTCAKPIRRWKDLIASRAGKKHMELVARLKETHGFGHGHADALVADTFAARKDKV